MATTLGIRRLAAAFLAAAMTALASLPAGAGINWMPMLPDQDFYDFQMFAPPDLQQYSIRPDAREGMFFTYDRTYWAFTPAPSRKILNEFFIPVQPLNPYSVAKLNNDFIQAGVPGTGVYVFGSDPLRLDLNTNWMRTDTAWGNRFEGGWIYEDFGMLFNYYDSGNQEQQFTTVNEFAVNSPTSTFTQTPVAGGGFVGGNVLLVTTITSTSGPPDHLISQNLTQFNSTELRSGGFSWVVRRNLSSAGSGHLNLVRFSFGPQWLQAADRYNIQYESNQYAFPQAAGPRTAGTPLQNGGWETSSYNNIVGPCLGLNYKYEENRWTLETDLRFTAGFNWQNTLYRGSNFPAALGADYFRSTFTFANTVAQTGTLGQQQALVGAPPQFVQIYGVGQTNAANSAEHNFVFSPLGEWRLRARYRVSQAISLNVGYTGMWLGGITRASSNTEFKESLKPVLSATQNGPPISYTSPNPQYNPLQPTDPVNNPQFITTSTTSWTPPPVNRPLGPNSPGVSNNRLRVYNTVGARPGNDLGYMFVNGVDFGIEVNY